MWAPPTASSCRGIAARPGRRSPTRPARSRHPTHGAGCAASTCWRWAAAQRQHVLRSEEHTSELQSPCNLVCRLLLEKKKNNQHDLTGIIHSDLNQGIRVRMNTLTVSGVTERVVIVRSPSRRSTVTDSKALSHVVGLD